MPHFLGTLRPMIFFPSVKDSSGIQTYSNTLVHFQEAHISRIDHLKHWFWCKMRGKGKQLRGKTTVHFFPWPLHFYPTNGSVPPSLTRPKLNVSRSSCCCSSLNDLTSGKVRGTSLCWATATRWTHGFYQHGPWAPAITMDEVHWFSVSLRHL